MCFLPTEKKHDEFKVVDCAHVSDGGGEGPYRVISPLPMAKSSWVWLFFYPQKWSHDIYRCFFAHRCVETYLYLNLNQIDNPYTYTLPPTIMVQWKMAGHLKGNDSIWGTRFWHLTHWFYGVHFLNVGTDGLGSINPENTLKCCN